MFPETPAPGKDWLLVFVSDDMDAMRAAAAAAMAVGYERTAVLEGGVQGLTQSALQQVIIVIIHVGRLHRVTYLLRRKQVQSPDANPSHRASWASFAHEM